MIVDPDFFDHWRTRMVVDALGGDEMAPMYIMRLWSHCQNRKADTFAIPSAGIKALCKFPGDAAALEQALIDAEYIVRSGNEITVVGWAEKNASLLAAWENGSKGGRPKKPSENPRETHGKPSGNPAVTQPEPMGNPDETDKSREEKRREEGNTGEPARASRKQAVTLEPHDLATEGVDPQHAKDWRKARKSPITPTAWDDLKTEARKAGITPAEAVRICAAKGWRGFNAGWNWQGNPRASPSRPTDTTAEAARLLGFIDGDVIDA